jgi:hypothetical protein
MRPSVVAALGAALTAALSAAPAAAQEVLASPEAIALGDPLDLRQVDFRLVRVVSEQAFQSDPDSHELLEVKTIEGAPFSLPIDPEPLMRVTQLESAVVRQDAYGLYHLDIHFQPADGEAYAAITAANAGRRALWMSHDSVLSDLLFTGRDESGGFSILYGDTPLESIENVLRLLQIDYTVEFAENLIVPATRADELRLEAMRELRLRPNTDGRRRAMILLAQALEAGGPDYEFRARILYVIGSLQFQLGQSDEAARTYFILTQEFPDFEDMIEVLRGLQTIAAGRGDQDATIAFSREIVERAGGRGPEAIDAQSVVCNLLLASDPRPPEFEAEARRMVSMLRDHMTTLPREQRHDLELRVISYLAEIDDRDELLRTARARLSDLPRDPFLATSHMTSIGKLMAVSGYAREGLSIVEEYAEVFQEGHDLEAPENQPYWDHIQAAVADLEAMTEESDPRPE